MHKFFIAPNLGTMELVEGAPWDFVPEDDELKNIRGLTKLKRRSAMLRTDTQWNIYTPVRCQDPHSRLSKGNPAVGVRGFVADYDLKQSPEDCVKLLSQMKEDWKPQFIEVSLSGKIRLVWVFEREIMVPSTEFLSAMFSKFAALISANIILAGYDAASEKPAQVWTNGGEWYEYKETPVPHKVMVGIVTKIGQNDRLFGVSEIPLEKIADEVQARFPDRWAGDFKVDATGVRFWDPKADNPAGCQIKPDGMLCFTGNVPFMSWSEIFGHQWTQQQEVLHLGAAADDIYFDGKNYWEHAKGRWNLVQRTDIMLRLKNRGLSDRTPRGANTSEVERVLNFIQVENRIDGAAPLVNYAQGIVQHSSGQVLLNTSKLYPFDYSSFKGTPDPEKDFPWTWKFITGLFKHSDHVSVPPYHFFLAWFKRSQHAVNNHKRLMGQALFFCGPSSNGKTLLCSRIIAPLLGGRYGNPYDYFVGNTIFNDDLFASYLWAIHDEEAPKNEAAKMKFLAKMKASVVNPVHGYHPKFCSRITVDWVGRMVATLNDDPASVGMLPEINPNTVDKTMFFATQPYADGVFPLNVEEVIWNELPAFAKWLAEVYQPPEEVLSKDRMGVKSYFDPTILDYSQQQSHAYNLVELMAVWMGHTGMFHDEEGKDPVTPYWEGTPTDLMAHLGSVDTLSTLLRDWSAPKIARSLTALSKMPGSGVEFIGNNDQRLFRIHRIIYDRTQEKPHAPDTQ